MASTPLTAVAKVLSTFELIENILLFLPLRQLLLAKRINKATFDVISGSSNIRGALFLKVRNLSISSISRAMGQTSGGLNPLGVNHSKGDLRRCCGRADIFSP